MGRRKNEVQRVKQRAKRVKKEIVEEVEVDKYYGGCEGPNSQYIKMISSDHHEFIIKREHAIVSTTIKAMLLGPGYSPENETNEIYFRGIP